MTLKEQIFSVMERITEETGCKGVTIIICCEAPANEILSLTGFRNSRGAGKVLYLSAKADTISKKLDSAWNFANDRNHGTGDD